MNLKSFKKIYQPLIVFLVILLFLYYIKNNFSDIVNTFSLSPWIISGIFITNIFRIYNNGEFVQDSLAHFQKRISKIESFYVALITAIGNFFGPLMGGVGVRGVYLKNKHGLSYKKFLSTLFGFYYITFFVNALIGLLALVFIHIYMDESSFILYVAYGGWLTMTLLLASVKNLKFFRMKSDSYRSRHGKLIEKIFSMLDESIAGWKSIQKDRRLLIRLLKITFVGFILLYIQTYIQFIAVGAETNVAGIALYVTISTFSLLVSFTPSSIGIREALFIFSSQLVGLSVDMIIAIAILDRSITFIVLSMGYLSDKAFNIRNKLIN